MKPKSNRWLIVLLSFGLFLSSCGAGELNKKAESTAVVFYSRVQTEKFDSALMLCSDQAFTGDSKEKWRKALEKNVILLGQLKSFTKTSGFNIATSTSLGTTVTMIYDVQYEYGKSQDSLILLKTKDGSMKLYRYSWKHKDANYVNEMMASEKSVDQYMTAVKENKYDDALALCSEEALRITPAENWVHFLDNAQTKLGPISSYQIVRDSSSYNIGGNGQSGKGNYYDIYVRSTRGGSDVMEKIVFFQKSYNEPIKLAGHSFL